MNLIKKYIFIFIIALLMSSIVYRYQICNVFSFEFGDKYDDIIAISLLEHWYNVIFDSEIWSKTQFFYPYTKTIGYSDSFFLLGIVYSFIRYAGAEPILANELVGFVFHIIGYVAFYIMLRTVWKFAVLPSFFAAGVVCLSNNMWMQSIHIQLYVVYLVPVIVLLLYKAGECLKRDSIFPALLWASCGSILYGACLMTGFYLMWFFTFFVLIFFLIYMLYAKNRSMFFAFMAGRWWLLLPALVIAIVPTLPLLYVYLEKARETGMQSWVAARHLILPLTSLINIGRDNILYHWIMILIPNGSYNRDVEFSVAFTPILVICVFYTIFSKRFNAFSGCNKAFWKAFILAIAVSVFFSIHVGKFYPWYIVYHLVPAAKSMRAVARFMLFLSLPVAVVFALFLNKLQQNGKVVLSCLLGTLVLFEQLNAAPILKLDRAANDAFYNQLPLPPHECKSFFVIDAPPTEADNDEEGVYHGNVPAMLYSELHHIPTVNGFTTFYPSDWHFDHPYFPDIVSRAKQYAMAHHIEEGFCSLDLTTKTWTHILFEGQGK